MEALARIVQSVDGARVPDTIQGIIMARLDRLGDDGKRTVQLASVLGRQFLVRLLQRVGGLTGRLEGLLQELKALEIIYELGLLDEEVYSDRVADHCEELAHHFYQGEDWRKAFDYLVSSGDRAKDAYANQAALDFYARALEVAPRVAPPVDQRPIMDIHQRRSEVWRLMSSSDEAIAESERMLAIAREVGDRQAEGQEEETDAPTRVRSGRGYRQTARAVSTTRRSFAS